MGDLLMRRYLPIVIVVIALLLPGAVSAQAQGLVDPTKPPAELLATGMVSGAAASSALQSILLSRGRKIAVINGQSVSLGGKYGDATLVGISAGEVTLKSDKGVEVMKLYPGLEKSSATFQPRQVVKGTGK